MIRRLWLVMGPDRSGPQLDSVLIGLFAVLAAIGTLVITSASMEVASANFGNPFYNLIRHLIYLGLGLGCALFCYLVPMKFWEKTGGLWLLLAFVLLVAVLVPGIGREVNGSMRWINLGVMNMQPSELAKLFVIVYLAGYLSRRLNEVRNQWRGFIKPLAVVGLVMPLLLMEPDFGAVVVLMCAALGMMFLGGVRLQQFLALILVTLVGGALLAVSQPYRMQRLITFMDPWAEENVYSGGYQLTQALIAFGRGEWTGVGLGNSVQKLFYLPEAHTDFVFAIWGEEMGLLGSLLVIALYGALVWRGLQIGRKAEKQGLLFPGYLAYGITLMLSAQALINIGVNTGLLPTKGLTLPLLSYGGSSILLCGLVLGLLLRVDCETQRARYQAFSPKNTRQRGSPTSPVEQEVLA